MRRTCESVDKAAAGPAFVVQLTSPVSVARAASLPSYSSAPQPAVGSHRLWAGEVVALLLAANCSVIDRLVAAAKLLPRLLHLALHRPLCSALHTRALRALRAATTAKVDELMAPLFFAGWGAGLQGEGPAAGKPCKPLHEMLADMGGWG